MSENFYIGQIFEVDYPVKAAEWCNNRADCYIAEIEGINSIQRFKILKIPERTDLELKVQKIASIKTELADLDMKSIRALRANEISYLETYELQALLLREQLKQLEGDTFER